VAALLLLPASAPAQTNAPSDPDRFFEQFNQAALLIRDNHASQAALVMDQLVKNLGSSPWLDIAVLKASGLQETRRPETALESYALLTRRLNVAPYFQGDTERAKVFRVAIQGAIDRGITRIRIQRIRSALAEYHARYRQYPESLQKLSILGYVEMEDVHDAAGHLIRYLPTGMQFTPAIAYQLYELAAIPAEPFLANAPYLTGTSQVNDQPLQYAALFKVSGRAEPERVTENQTFSGFFVAAVANRGAIVVTPERVLVLPVRP
jgi:hypothetical protein